MAFELAPLPYERDALSPTISKETLDFHYGAHHKAYVDMLNTLLPGSPYEGAASLEEIIKRSKHDGAVSIFNNAGQVWNHDLYWRSLSPNGGAPEGALLDQINKDFGSVDALKAALVDTGMKRFASGWSWLVWDKTRLSTVATMNAETPLTDGLDCLLVLDVWEHAYYIDYRNKRKDHLEKAVGLLDWKAAGQRFASAKI